MTVESKVSELSDKVSELGAEMRVTNSHLQALSSEQAKTAIAVQTLEVDAIERAARGKLVRQAGKWFAAALGVLATAIGVASAIAQLGAP